MLFLYDRSGSVDLSTIFSRRREKTQSFQLSGMDILTNFPISVAIPVVQSDRGLVQKTHQEK